ncbi:elongation factor P [Microgenomates group bacterium]|nr:elongation factor P [Microgenomates group bacterium]
MATVNGGNLKKGMYIDFRSQPHQVTMTQFVSPGKGSAFTRAKLRNLKTNNTIEFTFKTTEMIEILDIGSRELVFSYVDADEVWFMDERTFEQYAVDKKLISDQLGFLVPDLKVYILFYDEKPIGVSFPPKVKMKVQEAPEAIAGDRVNAGKKPVTMETGLTVQAPLFVKTGDTLIIETDSGQYVSRAN